MKDTYSIDDELKRLNLLRGMAALAVVFGHAIADLGFKTGVLGMLSNFADLAVCYFFLISGMGLAYNANKKERYLNGFLIRKISSIMIPVLIYVVLLNSLPAIFYRTFAYLLEIPNCILHLSWNWYINEIIIFYVLFYLVYRFISNENGRIVLIWAGVTTICLLFLYVWKYTNLDIRSRSYYTSAYSFSLGIILGEKWEEFYSFIVKRPIIKGIVLMGGAFSCLYSYLKPSDTFFYGVLMKNTIGICLMTLLCQLLIYFDIFGMKHIAYLLRNLSKISFEIYLYHGYIIYLVINYIDETCFWKLLLIIIVLTIPLAFIMNKVDITVKKILWKSGLLGGNHDI